MKFICSGVTDWSGALGQIFHGSSWSKKLGMVLLDRSKKIATQSFADTLVLDRSFFNKPIRDGSPGQVNKGIFSWSIVVHEKKLGGPGSWESLDFVQVGHMVVTPLFICCPGCFIWSNCNSITGFHRYWNLKKSTRLGIKF